MPQHLEDICDCHVRDFEMTPKGHSCLNVMMQFYGDAVCGIAIILLSVVVVVTN